MWSSIIHNACEMECDIFSDGPLLLPHGYSFGRLETLTLSKRLQDDQSVSISREFTCEANS